MKIIPFVQKVYNSKNLVSFNFGNNFFFDKGKQILLTRAKSGNSGWINKDCDMILLS